MVTLLPHGIVVLTSAAGFAIAYYISQKKRAHTGMVCPLRGNCTTVIESQYSRFLGIPVEWLGMAYYLTIGIAYTGIVLLPDLGGVQTMFVLLTMTTAAFLFSLYLSFIQIFNIKAICTWCFLSAILSATILAASITASDWGVVELLGHNRDAVAVINLLGLALGVGTATVATLLTFRFVRDWRITSGEADVLHLISQLSWFSLAVVLISAIGLYAPLATGDNWPPMLVAQTTVIIVLILNEAFFQLVVAPRLVTISFKLQPAGLPATGSRGRRAVFAMGAISLVCWYTIFVLTVAPPLTLSAQAVLGLFATLLAAGLAISQLVAWQLGRRYVQPQ